MPVIRFWHIALVALLAACCAQDAAAIRPPAGACSCDRNTAGACLRSGKARAEFLAQTGYPHGRAGFHVDHMVPLCCGGADAPHNMQWMRTSEKRLKDQWELDCSRYAPSAKGMH